MEETGQFEPETMYLSKSSAMSRISNTRSIFKRSAISFPSYLTKTKDLNLAYYLSIAGANRCIHTFPKDKQLPQGFELRSLIPFPARVHVTLSTPLTEE